VDQILPCLKKILKSEYIFYFTNLHCTNPLYSLYFPSTMKNLSHNFELYFSIRGVPLYPYKYFYYNSTHLYNIIIIIIRHPSYCYHYNVINISPITPHIYIIQLQLLLHILHTVTTIML
jgi:hypothetical protein